MFVHLWVCQLSCEREIWFELLDTWEIESKLCRAVPILFCLRNVWNSSSVNQFKSKLNEHIGRELSNDRCALVSILMRELIFYLLGVLYFILLLTTNILYACATAAAVTIKNSIIIFWWSETRVNDWNLFEIVLRCVFPSSCWAAATRANIFRRRALLCRGQGRHAHVGGSRNLDARPTVEELQRAGLHQRTGCLLLFLFWTMFGRR